MAKKQTSLEKNIKALNKKRTEKMKYEDDQKVFFMNEEWQVEKDLTNDKVLIYQQREFEDDNGWNDSAEPTFIIVEKKYLSEEQVNSKEIEQYNKRIKDLKLTIKDYNKQITKLRLEAAQIENENEKLANKEIELSKRHIAIDRITDFLDGKITHYVCFNYAEITVIPIENSMSLGSSRDLKLLSLYGGSRGDLSWKLHCYSDGSGFPGNTVYPCIGLEEVKKYVNERIHERLSNKVLLLGKAYLSVLK
jgi:hypothetical protein